MTVAGAVGNSSLARRISGDKCVGLSDGYKKSNYQLPSKVIENSEAKEWDLAVREWEIVDCEESEENNAEERNISATCSRFGTRGMATRSGRCQVFFGSSCIVVGKQVKQLHRKAVV